MQSTPDVSVLQGGPVKTETFGVIEMYELLQFHPVPCVDMDCCPL